MKKIIPLTAERIAILRACPTMSVGNAVQIFGFGQNKIYEFLKDGRVASVKIDGTRRLITSSLEALLNGPPQQPPVMRPWAGSKQPKVVS
jgi:hypothetical protein